MGNLWNIFFSLYFLFPFQLFGTTVTNASELEAAIIDANASGDTTIELSQDIPYSQLFRPVNATPEFAPAGKTITIRSDVPGAQRTLSSGGSFRGVFIFGNTGECALKDLRFFNAIAKGGDGGAPGNAIGIAGSGGGGGGAGLGGGLFIAQGSQVSIQNVSFQGCQASGGNATSVGVVNGTGGAGGGGLHFPGAAGLLFGGGGGGGFGGSGAGIGAAGGGGGGSGENGMNPPSAVGGDGGNNFDLIAGGGNGGTSGSPDGGNGTIGGGGGGGASIGGRGGNGGDGGNGGGGGGGGADNTAKGKGGNGGLFGGGGGGGGGGGPVVDQGSGGFGGGGGGAGIANTDGGNGGSGGFGGGGGGGSSSIPGNNGNGGLGGFGGGNGAPGGAAVSNTSRRAGGGGAMGGAIFMAANSTLTVIGEGVTFSGCSSIAGNGANNGQALGSEIFMQSSSELTFQNLTQNCTIPSAIKGNQGSEGEDPTAGGLTLGTGNTATVTLNGDNTYTGTTTIESGTLLVNGSLTTPVVVNGGIFGGTATLKAVPAISTGDLTISGGEVCPAGDGVFGTTTVEGNYSQGANATFLNVEVDSVANTDLIAVNGTATLAGTLAVEAAVGNFIEGEVITILTAGGGVITAEEGEEPIGGLLGDFDTVTVPLTPNGNPLFGVQYLPNSVQLVVLQDVLFVMSVSQDIFPGNPQQVSNYLEDILPIAPGSDLAHAVEVLGLLETIPLNQALNQLHPALFGGLEWINLSHTSFAASLLSEHLRTLSCSRCHCSSKNPDSSKNNLWAQPYGIWDRQDKIGQLRGFKSDSAGIVVGYDRCWNAFNFGIAGGYSYTHIGWKNGAGKGKTNRVYGALYSSYTHPFFNADLSVMGGGNFYRLERRISYSAIGRPNAMVDYTASSTPTGVTFHTHLGIAGKLDHWQVPLRLAGKLDYAYLHRKRFREKNASDLSLDVRGKASNMIRTELGIEYAPTFVFTNSCVSPYVGVAWVTKIPLSSSRVISNFVVKSQTFSVNTTSHAIQQVMPSCGVKVTSIHGFSLAIATRLELGGQVKNYFADLRLDYCF